MVQETNGSSDEAGREKERPRNVKKKAVALVPTKLIHADGDAVLVEWHDGQHLQRGIIPASERAANDVPEDVLEAAMPWGDDWTQVEGVTDDLAAALHDIGIWTAADMLARSHLVRNAAQQVYVVPIVARLLRFAKTNK